MLKWSSNWCFYFNTNKCSVLHSGEKNTDCDYFMSIGEVDYKINNSQLVKYLGVTFDLLKLVELLKLLKLVAEELAPALTIIFQQSYDLSSTPKDWNSAIVTPIYKKGLKSDPSNY